MREDQHIRYEACFELYKKNAGRKLSRIEREMRALGFTDFHRRILYGRKENGIWKPGWIEKYGWHHLIGGNRSGSECAPRISARVGSRDSSKGTLPTGRVTAFQDWLKQISPNYNWNWKYQQYIYRHLERITSGENKRLMIFLPPRHGKSELVTVRYAGWRLWNDPTMKIIVSSYNQKLADRFSRGIRRLLSEEEDRRMSNADLRMSNLPAPNPHSWALPTDVRKGSAFPEAAQKENGGSASDVRQCESCDHPQCTCGAAANQFQAPIGKAEPFRTSDGVAVGPATHAEEHPDHSQITNRNSQIPRMFPRTRTINTASQWETAAGGGVKAVGVGAGVTGFGGQLIVIDDPVKSRAEAESETYRERVWDWYRNDLYTRLEPNGSIILIQTRWHEDDLAGRLLKEMQTGGDQWEVVNLPALSEPRAVASRDLFNAETQRRRDGKDLTFAASNYDRSLALPSDVRKGSAFPTGPLENLRGCASASTDGGVAADHSFDDNGKARPFRTSGGLSPESNDPLGRPIGAALCPERYDENALGEIRRQLGGYAFSALYQQSPTPAEGGIFKRAWFKRFVDQAPEGLKWKRGYDLAVSTKTTSCYTSSFRVAYDDAGDMYLADGFRERIEFPDQKRYIISRLASEKDTEHGVEKAIHGEAIIQELRREPSIRGSILRGITVTADKLTRALKWSPLAEEGKVILVRGPWNQAFLDEICNFPGGQYDDQVDAVSLAVAMFENRGRKVHTF